MHTAHTENTEPPVNGQPNFNRVAQCLYRNSANNIYYALVKKQGRQHRKSLKTTDRQLAERRLFDYRGHLGRLVTPTKDRNITFMELARDWFDAAKTRYKASSAAGAEVCFRQLNKHFGSIPVRNLAASDFHNWEKKRGPISARHRSTTNGRFWWR